MKQKLWRTLCALALACVGSSGVAAAEAYPVKPVRIIVPAAAGGALDITTRLVAQKVGDKLGQPVIVENRPGGDSLLGTRFVKDAAADGYTLLAHSNAFAATPALKLDRGYDPLKHFTGVPMSRKRWPKQPGS